MPSHPDVDFISSRTASVAPGIDNHYAEKRVKKQRLLVLLVPFVVLMLITLGYIWSRPAIYQSVAVLHFSVSQDLATSDSALATEHIQLYQQRFLSFRIIEQLSQQLAYEYDLDLSTEELAKMLSVEGDTLAKIIRLQATGTLPNQLKPVLDEWLALIMQSLAQESQTSTETQLAATDDKLALLEDKIEIQQMTVQQFSDEHNIVSLTREENRAINKVKSITEMLNKADEREEQAISKLNSLQLAQSQGKIVTRPADAQYIAQLNQQITSIEANLDSLRQRYTAEYMQLDPAIVSKVNQLNALKTEREQFVQESQRKYEEELEQAVEEAQFSQQQLTAQLEEVTRTAQQFNRRLKDYEQLTHELNQLQTQAQSLRDSKVVKEVEQAFAPNVTVLESPYTPLYPVGPDYAKLSLLAAAGSAVISVLILLLYSFIVRQKAPANTITSYTVVPNTPASPIMDLPNGQQHLGQQQQLGQQTPPLQLEQTQAQSHLLLSVEQCQQLFEGAGREGKIIIALLLHGVSIQELLQLSRSQIDFEQATLFLPPPYERQLILPEAIIAFIAAHKITDEEGMIWQQPLTVKDLTLMLSNAAHDAGLHFPEQVTAEALRHAYLTWLVAKGAKLSDLEKLAGYVPPSELAVYRSVNRQQGPLDIDQIDPAYPLVYR